MKRIVIGLLTFIIIASAGSSGAVCLKTNSNPCAAYTLKATVGQNTIAVTNNAVTATSASTPATATTKQPATATSTPATATTKQPATATSTPATATTKQPATATSTPATATTKQPATATSTPATATTKQPATATSTPATATTKQPATATSTPATATTKQPATTTATTATATPSPSATKAPNTAASQNIVITMVNRDNQPISKLEVILQDNSNSGYKYYDVTNEEGAVYFPNLPMGTYTMTVNRPDSSYIYSTVMLLEGANESKILESQGSSSGAVRDYDIDINTSASTVGISFMFKGTFIGIVGIEDNPPIPKDEPAPSSTPAPEPSATPSPSLTPSPEPAPTANDKPTTDAGAVSTPDLNKPTQAPDAVPTTIPSDVPQVPSAVPSSTPSDVPQTPSAVPTTVPSIEPQTPSAVPSSIPSSEPQAPSTVPTTIPSDVPQVPSAVPSAIPTSEPQAPSAVPTTIPSDVPQVPSAGQAGTNLKPAPTATSAQNTQQPTVSQTKPPAPQTTTKPVGSASSAPTTVVNPQNTAKPTGQAATTSTANALATNTTQSQSTVEQAANSANYPPQPAQLAGTPYLGGTLSNYDGNPIAGAYIDSNNADTKGLIQGVTDDNGSFMLSGIAAGKHFIRAYNAEGVLIGVVELDVVDGDTTEYINNGLTHKLVIDPTDQEVYMILATNGDGGIIVRSAEALNSANDSNEQTRPAFSPAMVLIPVIAACAAIVIILLVKKRKNNSHA